MSAKKTKPSKPLKAKKTGPPKKPHRRAKSTTNVLGDRGENIFELVITDYSQFPEPIFRPGFLGEKWPTIDYYVELLKVKSKTPFFFVQVKGTRAAFNTKANTLPIRGATKTKCGLLFRVPGPTYIVGVHEPSQRAFILSLHAAPKHGVYNIPLTHELTPANLKVLYDEVLSFWKSSPHKPTGSKFA